MAFIPNESQKKVLECRDHLCVIAGAGSGKTGTLVETLVVRLMESFYASQKSDIPKKALDITEILALTFTEKAASELRQRLSATFSEKRKAASGVEAEFWKLQGARLDRADIGTIHGYALKLVRENSLALGLASVPGLDEDDRVRTTDLAQIITDWLDEGDENLLALLKHYSLDTLSLILDKCVNRQSSWGLSAFTADLELGGSLIHELAEFKDLVFSLRDWGANGGLDQTKISGRNVLATLEATALHLNEEPEKLMMSLDEVLLKCHKSLSGSGNWYAAKPRKDELLETLYQLLARRNGQLVIPFKEKLLALTARLTTDLQGRKKKRGCINFDDILILARRLLAGRPEIRKREILRRRLILIDEFQDTNRLQADILGYLLLREDDNLVYPEDKNIWNELCWENIPPRFSAFGDLKQSIYRFRGAEVEVMAALRRALSNGGGQVLALQHNYRSQEPLINFFNAFFSSRLGEETFTSLDHQLSQTAALYDSPAVVQLRTTGPAPKLKAEQLALQATVLTYYLNDIFQGHRQLLLHDQSSEAGRKPGPGDVAVLFRQHRDMLPFKEILTKAGWNCRLASGDNPFDYAEVKGLLGAFKYLAGQDEDFSLAAMLRSPLGPVSDDGLIKLVWNGDNPTRLSTYFYNSQTEFPDSLNKGDLAILKELRQLLLELKPLVGRLPSVEILERLVERRRLISLAVAEPDGEDRAKAITTILALSRTLGQNRDHQHLSPAEELAEWRDNWNSRKAGESSPDGEAITLMTVHGSKGLEFPIVILARADVKPKTKNDPVVISDTGQLALKYNIFPVDKALPPDYQAIRDREDLLEERENGRLLYVAATRARDHLVFLGWPQERKEKKPPPPDSIWLEALLNRPEVAALTSVVEYAPEDIIPPGSSEDERCAPLESHGQIIETAAQKKEPIEEPQLLEPMTLEGQALAVTSLGQLLASPEKFYREKHLGLDRDLAGLDWQPGLDFFNLHQPSFKPKGTLAPTEAGTLFHAVLEYLDPLNPSPAQLVWQQAARLRLTPDLLEVETIASKVETFLNGPQGQAWQETLAAGLEDFRELPFQMKIANLSDEPGHQNYLTVRGVIDLFFITPKGEGLIIDYKLAPYVSGPEVTAYENQVRLYAQALRYSGFAGALKAFLYFAGGNEPISHEVEFDQEYPLRSLTTELIAGLNFLKTTRPLRPSRPGPHGVWPS